MNAGLAFVSYLALSLVLTWPLVLGIARDVPGDLGDSLLNMWILAWGAEQVPRLFTGATSWAEFWNANIFHPEPLALALSEHLFGQTLQILPVYWLTGNIILCYNLLFISTFALSAFGTYLLVRDLTGDRRAAFVAGLIYGFLPYRIASVPHLQVLSSHWMPFALWGLNRFVDRFPASGSPPTRPLGRSGETSPEIAPRAKAGRIPAIGALAVGVGALVLQNWSCGYYLLYFAPFVPLFVLHRMWTAGTLRNPGLWLSLVMAAAITLAFTMPFLLPYRQAQELFAIERAFGEVMRFSASAWSYMTASENIRLYGSVLRFHPGPEGETFLGFVPWILAAIGLVAVVISTRPMPSGSSGMDTDRRLRIVKWALGVVAVTQLLAFTHVVLFGGFDVTVLGLEISARTPMRMLMQGVAAGGLLLAVSPRLRHRAAQLVRSPVILCFGLTLLAIWLSLGPMPLVGDSRVSGYGVYGALYDYVPGFNGVRVPARFAMIAGLFLAILAGYGAPFVIRHSLSVIPVAALVLLEGAAVPMEINRTWNQDQATPPARVLPAAQAPPVYARVASLPSSAVISEFPYGDGAWEIRYVYYAAAHWRRITNGYSGAFPPHYKERAARLQRVEVDPEAAWQSLRATGTTHVVFHRNAFANPAIADMVESWLKSHGAAELERFADEDVLYSVDF